MADRDADDTEESVREAVEQARSGAPAVGHTVPDRFTSNEIFQRVIAAAEEEMTSRTRELAFSGLAAGFSITATFLLYAALTEASGGSSIIGALLYPLGFVHIILGNYQLYTENTLPPVALVLERLASIPALLRVWTVVLLSNAVGGVIGAYVLANTGVFSPEVATTAVEIGMKGIETGWWSLFFKAAFAGLLVAAVVWLDYAARDTISRIVLVYATFLTIPLGNLYHSVVTVTEVSYLVFQGQIGLAYGVGDFFLPVLLGNTLGGVLLVTVVNYFQTTERRLRNIHGEDYEQLSLAEWVGGRIAGDSYVPDDRPED